MREVLNLGLLDFPFKQQTRAALSRGIRKRRVDLNLNQAGLARMLSLSVSYLSQIETTKRIPSLQLICRIAEKLKTSVSELFIYGRTKKEDPYLEALIKAIKILERMELEVVSCSTSAS